MLLTENQLDEWVRANSRDAQGVIVELIWRLVVGSCPRPPERRFPLGDSINQPGPDGFLNTDMAYEPFVPLGKSFWEIGTGLNAASKATSDYNDRTADTPGEIRKESAFIFVTPLSATRDWKYTWKEGSQASWIEKRAKKKEWKEIRVIDGTKLIDWLRQFPAAELWMSANMGIPADGMETIEQSWGLLRNIGAPPPLLPDVFLGNRDDACVKLKEFFSRTQLQLKLESHFPYQIVQFVAAYVANMEDNFRVEIIGRCAVVSNIKAWNAIMELKDKHFLVADPSLDLTSEVGMKLIEKARMAGHFVVYGAAPGGIPHPNTAKIPNPRDYQIREALIKSGYKEERARTIAQKSGGNLGSLLRCLQNLSLMPEWAERTTAAELAIAEILGSWDESSKADITAAERLSGKAYGEWIETIREIILRPGTPLIQRDSIWKFIARYEGWYALGPRLFDKHLDLILKESVRILKEADPKFDLPREEQFTASIHGKVLSHSTALRNGLADCLALLGSHPKALLSCTLGKPESTAALAVRGILSGTDWKLWASLNDQLPLLAEASPDEFLDAVEKALSSDPCPFDKVFEQEGSGVMDWNYMTGLLWALETLAWSEVYLARATVILGELAVRDPGGNWANRPSNSLTTIMLPWMPQTCAPIEKRIGAVSILIKEKPDIAWNLLLSLLPSSHQMSSGTRRPAWREFIPENWPSAITRQEYADQVIRYTDIVIEAAKNDLSKLAQLIDRIEDLPLEARNRLIEHLDSDSIADLPEETRLKLWEELIDLINKHKRHADAKWAMEQDQIDVLSNIAGRLEPRTPAHLYRRLFSERDLDLYEGKGDWHKQAEDLEERRRKAVAHIYEENGIGTVIDFAKKVESPWRVGIALGAISQEDADKIILPDFINIDDKTLIQFTAGFVRGKFNCCGWSWVDKINTANWSNIQIGQFLAYLPFGLDTWKRAKDFLKDDESIYWNQTNANPYETDNNLDIAVNRLIEFGRPGAAIRCLHKNIRDKNLMMDSTLAIRALLAFPKSSERPLSSMLSHEIAEVIRALQEDPNVSVDDLFRIEWIFLRLLDRNTGGPPRLLEKMLSEKPEFYCEVIRTVYRSKNEEETVEPTELQKNMASNAYHLLHYWRKPPGIVEDGSFDGDRLNRWVKFVKEESAKTGHFEVAMHRLGYVLIYAPPDPDGLWIHNAAASILNEKDTDMIRDGFRNGQFNSRGVYTGTGGKEELKIAENYKSRADELEAKGFHRLAATIRELAKAYEHESERESRKEDDF